MTVGELETLVRLQVPAILVLFNNGTFGWIKGLHRLKGHNQCFGVDFMPPQGQAIAEAYGLKAWTAKTGEELDGALAQAFAWKDGPCIIDVHVESIADRVPPVYSWLLKRGEDPLDLKPMPKSYLEGRAPPSPGSSLPHALGGEPFPETRTSGELIRECG